MRLEGRKRVCVCAQIPCPTLHDVINALVDKTAGTLQPFLLEEPYEENISMSNTRTKNCSKITSVCQVANMHKHDHAGAESL